MAGVLTGDVGVVRVLIQMRLRVLRHSLRGKQAGFTVLGLVIGLVAAGATLLAAGADFDQPGVGTDVLAVVYLMWTIGWLFAPVLTGGGDETLRPEHFALLPLSSRQLAAGLLGSAFVGVPAVVTAVAFFGLLVHASGAHVLVALVAIPLQLVFVVLLSRVTSAALGAVLRSRRGRDLGILLAAGVSMSGFVVQALVRAFGPALAAGDSPVLSAALRWSPSGWGTVAVTASWPVALACLVGLAAMNVALLAVWGTLLVRRVTRVAAVSRPATGRSFGGRTPLGAVVGKELRTWGRDVRRRVALLSTLVVGTIVSVGPLLSGDGGPSPFGGLALVAFGALMAGNLYGMDGSAMWHTLIVPGAARIDVRGRQVAWLVIVGPVALLLALVLPAVSDPGLYPWVLGIMPALLGSGAGLVVVLSVFTAYPMPDQKAGPFAAGGSPGLLRGLLQFAISLLLAVVALPVVVVVIVGSALGLPVVTWLGVPVGIVIGVLLFWWWGGIAGRRLDARGPELLAQVAKPV
jgi:ABC-2 type transport system permease protein